MEIDICAYRHRNLRHTQVRALRVDRDKVEQRSEHQGWAKLLVF